MNYDVILHYFHEILRFFELLYNIGCRMLDPVLGLLFSGGILYLFGRLCIRMQIIGNAYITSETIKEIKKTDPNIFR
ncbi:MAG: hypothetical protein V2B19_16425 [Pseudomonadota bacterium]